VFFIHATTDLQDSTGQLFAIKNLGPFQRKAEVVLWKATAKRLLSELNARLGPEEQIGVTFSTTKGWVEDKKVFFLNCSPAAVVAWIERVFEQNREKAVRS
jgi:hypothetical protein